MTIDTIINDCEQSIKQSELFIKAHQANMEIGEIKEYQYYIERDKLTADILRKYQEIEQIVADRKGKLILNTLVAIIKVVEDGQNTIKD